jgi:hypothetical protein
LLLFGLGWLLLLRGLSLLLLLRLGNLVAGYFILQLGFALGSTPAGGGLLLRSTTVTSNINNSKRFIEKAPAGRMCYYLG